MRDDIVENKHPAAAHEWGIHFKIASHPFVRVVRIDEQKIKQFAAQKPHPNAVHGRDVEQENHFIPKDAIAALMREAEKNGGKIDWVNCGLCVDERGATDAIPGVRRGSPADFWQMAEASDNTLVIATR